MSDKYELIDAEYAHTCTPAPTISQMCTWLDVSRSGFYEWRDRPVSVTAARRELLKIKIKTLFEASDGTYGYRRLHAELLRGGEHLGDELVRRLMRELGLVACQPRPYKTTTIPDSRPAPIPDLVRRDFTADAPGTKLVGDITYINTWQGWLYLATVIDCFNREVVGYAMADHMRTSLVTDAIEMAARNHQLAAGCIFHSVRGSQYTSDDFAAALADLDMRPSVGRTGICFDNALAESFNSALKVERVHRTVYPTRRKARDDIARYIEIFYNHQRIHSTLGYKTPQRSPHRVHEYPSSSIDPSNSVVRKIRGRPNAGATGRWRCAGARPAWSKPAASSAASTDTSTYQPCDCPRSPGRSAPTLSPTPAKITT